VTKEEDAMREEAKQVEVVVAGVPPAGGSATGELAPRQRWSVARKRDVVLRLLRGESVEALSRELGVEIYRLEKWREKGLSGLDAGLKEREGDPAQAELDAAMKRIGELTMENELLWQRVRKPGPLAKRRSSK
jgi:transposase-like protein